MDFKLIDSPYFLADVFLTPLVVVFLVFGFAEIFSASTATFLAVFSTTFTALVTSSVSFLALAFTTLVCSLISSIFSSTTIWNVVVVFVFDFTRFDKISYSTCYCQ